MTVPMATTNLFTDPVFKDGAFTSHDADVRAYALQKTMRAMDLGVELGARTYVFWGGREGAEVDAAKDPIEAIKRFRDAINFLCEYARDQQLRAAVRARSQAERAARRHLLPDDRRRISRSSPRWITPRWSASIRRSRTSTWSGLNFYHVVAQALEAGKLFHIDLNDQKPGRFDQDLRFGSESIKPLFFLVKLLEESGYDGPRHFDAHAYRTEDEQGVWDFARGCMRTYLILKEKARQFRAHAGIQALLAEIRGDGRQTVGPYHRSGAARSRRERSIATRSPRGGSLRAARPAGRRSAARRRSG